MRTVFKVYVRLGRLEAFVENVTSIPDPLSIYDVTSVADDDLPGSRCIVSSETRNKEEVKFLLQEQQEAGVLRQLRFMRQKYRK